MNIPIPDFVPILGSEVLTTIYLVTLIVGVCLIFTGFLFRFLLNRKGKKTTGGWICVVIGFLLTINPCMHLLF